VGPGDRAFTAHYLELERQLALAETGLGDHAVAAARLDALLLELEATRQPLALGLLHLARARVAHAMSDTAALNHHFAAMREHFAGTENPALIAQHEQFAGELASGAALAADSSEAHDTHLMLSKLEAPHERDRRALELLTHSTRALDGYLYRVAQGELILVASAGSREPPPGLGDAVRSALDRAQSQSITDDDPTVLEDLTIAAGTSETSDSDQSDAGSSTVVLLSVMRGSRSVVVGAAALSRDDGALAAPPAHLLVGIARALQEYASTTGQA
jgi:hypothetical protein